METGFADTACPVSISPGLKRTQPNLSHTDDASTLAAPVHPGAHFFPTAKSINFLTALREKSMQIIMFIKSIDMMDYLGSRTDSA